MKIIKNNKWFLNMFKRPSNKKNINEVKTLISKEEMPNYMLISKEEKKALIDKIKELYKEDNIVKIIKENDISIIQKRSINELCDNKKIDVNNFYKNLEEIIEKTNNDLLLQTKSEYQKINYLTISLELIEEILYKISTIENDYKNHKYNIYYYERKMDLIKEESISLKNMKNKPEVTLEILKLRKDLFSKSKDIYDILYSNEIFLYINKKCDDLINKVNAKVVDINKESKYNYQKEYLHNVILRFEDIKLSRELIQSRSMNIKNDSDIKKCVEELYNMFTIGLSDNFNFKKNKAKTELVILFNGINKFICTHKREKYILIEHINFRIKDLLEAITAKKNELSSILKNEYNIEIINNKFDDKITRLLDKY